MPWCSWNTSKVGIKQQTINIYFDIIHLSCILIEQRAMLIKEGPWLWSCDSWIYKYLCNQCHSPLKCEFESCSWRGVLDTTLNDKISQWLATGRWFSSVSSANKTDGHDITDILLKVVLNTITPWLVKEVCLLKEHIFYCS